VAVGVAELGQVQGDAAGYDVARGEFRVGVIGPHEPLAVAVDEDGSFTADGFGDEERILVQHGRCTRVRGAGARNQAGGVELEEFEVSHCRTGADSERKAVGGSDCGIGGLGKQLAGSAGCQEDGVAMQGC
jgi:hypothetical protein